MANGRKRRNSSPKTPSPYYRGVRARTGSSSGGSSIPNNQLALTPSQRPRPPFVVGRSANRYMGPSPGKRRIRTIAARSVSKSAGFFKKGTRKAAKNRYQYAKYGINKVLEYGGTSTTLEQTHYVGHGTCPQEEMCALIAGSIVKRFLHHIQKLKTDWNETLDLVPTGVIVVFFKPDYNNPTVANSTLTTGPVTALDIVQAFRNFLTTNFFDASVDTDFYGNQARIIKMAYITGPGLVQSMYLENAKVVFNNKSTLKIQNRTKDSDGSDSTDVVDIAPLYGKSYTGSGTGTAFVGNLATQPDLVIDSTYGVIDQPASNNNTQEPPIGKLFTNVKTVGKAHLDPGEIKTSVLTSRGKMFLNTLLHYVGSKNLGSKKKFFGKVGAFRFFALEKMLDCLNNELARRIDIAWEHNLNTSMMLLPGYEMITTSIFEKAYKP